MLTYADACSNVLTYMYLGKVLVIIKGKDEQREKARKLVMLSAEAEDADAERPLAPAGMLTYAHVCSLMLTYAQRRS
jgi:hypothetical protein